MKKEEEKKQPEFCAIDKEFLFKKMRELEEDPKVQEYLYYSQCINMHVVIQPKEEIKE
jgi:hypothetical protein